MSTVTKMTELLLKSLQFSMSEKIIKIKRLTNFSIYFRNSQIWILLITMNPENSSLMIEKRRERSMHGNRPLQRKANSTTTL